MARIRVPLTHNGETYGAHLPNYMEVPGTYEGGPANIHHKDGVHPGIEPQVALQHPITVEVFVPDRYVRDDGTLDETEVEIDRALQRKGRAADPFRAE